MNPSPEEMIADLAAAGWERVKTTIWRSPAGSLFRGPYGAWKVMRLNGPSNAEIEAVLAGIEAEAICNPLPKE